MRVGRFAVAGAVCVSSLMSLLVWSPISAEVSRWSSESIAAPEPIDPGDEVLTPAEPPAYVGHEVRTPEPMSARVVAEVGRPLLVEGLPVSLTVQRSAIEPAQPAGEPDPLETTTSTEVATAETAPAAPVEDPVDTIDTTATTLGSTTSTSSTTLVDGAVEQVELRVESLDAATVESLGGEIFAFGVEPTTASSVTVEVAIDYSEFRYALGAEWATRLQLVQWACDPAMAKVAARQCGNPVPVADVSNNLKTGVLTATVELGFAVGQGGGESLPMVLTGDGSTLGLASAAGSFQATSLSNSGSWQVGGNNGSFSYSTPIAVPPAFNGVGPSVSLSYDSSGVDGITSSVNAQASEVGLGWSLNAGQGFIERRYLPCQDSRIGGGTSDSCWYAQNATISLNGHASELVPVNGTTGDPDSFTLWRLKDDPDWLVQRFNSASGDWWTSEYWTVTTPEGMVYWFGRDAEGQGSRLVRPLRGISSSSDPCWSRTNKLCTDMPYRWMLDKVVDPYGNTMIYKYWREQNKAKTLGDGYTPVQYDMAALLTEILYGKTPATTATAYSPATPAIDYRGRIVFSYVRRCVEALSTSVDAHCPAVTNANGISYPDTPTDLYCPVSSSTCFKEPSFFQIRRLSLITTYTRSSDAGAWGAVAQWRSYGAFPDPGDGGNEKLWLYLWLRVTPDSTVTPPATAAALSHGTIFGGQPMQNRKDGNPGAGVPYMNQYRVNNIFDDLGQQITVTYDSTTCGPTYNWSTNTTNCFPMYASFPGGGAGWGIYRRWVVDSVRVRDLVAGNRGTGGTTGNGVAPDITTDYTYSGAAWHHDGDDWWVDTPGVDDVSWGQWRGYRTVTATTGTTGTKTTSKQVFYQGMHGDKAASGTKTVTMTRGFTVTGEGYTGTINDDDWLAGSVFETYQMDGTSTTDFLSASRSYSRWTSLSSDSTITRTGLPDTETRKWAMTLEHGKLRDGGTGSTSYKYTRSDTTVDTLGRVVRVHNSGFTDVANDGTCQRTIYIAGSTAPTTTSAGWMHLVAQSISYAEQGTTPDQTSYAPNAGACTGQPVGETKYFYNNNSHKATSTTAANASTQTLSGSLNPFVTATLTRTKNWDGATDWLNRWIATTSTFDEAGRTTQTFDARETRTALFSFNTTYGYPNKATYPLSIGFTQTVLRPQDGQPETTIDQNGNTTNYCYDSLSRLTKAYQPPLAGGTTPTCASSTEPTVSMTYNLGTFSYSGSVRVAKTPSIVVSSVLQSTSPTVRVESAALIDGFGRTRETQRHSPTSGKLLVTANLYDDRGNTVIGVEEFAIAGMPGNYASNSPAVDGFETFPALPTMTLRTNMSTIDTAGRVTTQARKNGGSTLEATDTEYLGSKTITKPQIGSYQATTVDGLGRTTRVDTYVGSTAPTAGFANPGAITTFQYSYNQTANVVGGHDQAGWLATYVSDDAGNVTTVNANMAGQTITSIDPNASATNFGYDPNGNILITVDQVGNRVHTEYDLLNRPTGRWSGTAGSYATAATADRLASWTYDTVTGGKGMAATETSWQNSVAYTTTINAYNTRYQDTATKINIPGMFGSDLLAGDWKFATTFNEAGQPVTVTKPLVPVDPATPSTPPSSTDVTTTNYNGFGQADQLWEGTTPTASTRYVIGTSVDDLGRITSRTLSRSTNVAVPALNRSYGYDTSTGALAEIKAGWSVSGTVSTWFQHDSYTRDAIGRVTRIDDLGTEPAGTASDVKECFIYDQWNRLVRAHSATIATACLTNTSAATVAATSRDPYDTVWTFDDINRMTTSTNKLAGSATTTYVPDTAHPHAVAALTGATTATYGYDLNGAMTNRDGDDLTYDAQQRLTSYASTETYVYATTNQRLIRQAGGTRTLYLPGMEVSVTGTTRTVNSHLTIGATQIGTKTAISGGGTTYAWACGNMQNTNICQTNVYTTSVTPAIPARKRYTPYGGSRQAPPVTFANTDRGFLNQPEDANGLVYLNNRYHDPTLGHFITVDPLVGQTGHPYLYGDGNPATLTDPTGLCSLNPWSDDDCYTDAVEAVVETSSSVASGVYNRVGTLLTYEYDSLVRQSNNPLQSMWDFVSGTTLTEQVSAIETIAFDDARLYREGPYCGVEAECFTGSDTFPGSDASTTGHTIRLSGTSRPSDALIAHEMQHVYDIESVGGVGFYGSYAAEWLVRFATPIPGGYHELYWERRGENVQKNYATGARPRGLTGQLASSLWQSLRRNFVPPIGPVITSSAQSASSSTSAATVGPELRPKSGAY